MSAPILIVHVVNALKAGGLENGVINLINRLPEDKFRHAVICLTDYDDFADRIKRPDVPLIALHKSPGKDWGWYLRMWKTLRSLNPDVVHSRNLATMETQLIAFFAGVRGRVHGEHGWDVYDMQGSNRKYRLLRRALSFFVQRFIPLSMELEQYLTDTVGVASRKVVRICNGVDTSRFLPRESEPAVQIPCVCEGDVVLGYVGRMEPVKDPLNLVEAFIIAAERDPGFLDHARLVMVGNGSLHAKAVQRLNDAGLAEKVWLPGHREDIAELLRSFDVFVLPSRAEGISNTILEAMATALPVVATRVGGNPELLEDGVNATLVAAEDSHALADALQRYVANPELRSSQGMQSRMLSESRFSIDGMVASYGDVYSQATAAV